MPGFNDYKSNHIEGRQTIGTAILYDVKEYKSEAEFVKDRNKHYADIKKFGSYRFGFMVRNAHRFRTPKPYPGRLRFFEVQYPFS